MRKIINLGFTILTITFVACADDNSLTSLQENDNPYTEKGISHFLNFSNENQFEAYMKQIEKKQSKTVKTRSFDDDEDETVDIEDIEDQMEGFVSLDQIEESEDEEWADDDEMTVDEFKAFEASELLIDPILKHVLDTTLQIKVGESYYKITKEGTFVADSQEDLNLAIVSFNPLVRNNLETGDTLSLDNGAKFINSFGSENIVSTYTSPINNPIDPNDEFVPNLHIQYNVSSHVWKKSSVLGKIWNFIRGKEISKDTLFDNSHRVKVEVFNVNYGFYKSCGVKVMMQKSKHFLGIKYWKGTKAEKLALGFNKLNGSLTLDNPLNYINFSAPSNWNNFTSTINNYTSDFVISKYKSIPILKDWIDNLYYIIPKITILNSSYPNYEMMNSLYLLPADYIYSFLKKREGMVLDKLKNEVIKSTDPRLVSLVWGKDKYKFEKQKNYIYGVVEYSNKKSKTVYFNQSFGFTFKNGAIGPYTPTDFKIQDIDFFGAAKYNNMWKGIRIYKEKD